MFTFTTDDHKIELIKNGYIEYFPSVSKGEWHTGLFQKTIRYSNGIAYFINIDQFDRSYYTFYGSGFVYEVSIQVESNMFKDTHLDLKFNPLHRTLTEVEHIIKVFFETFGRDYE